MELKTLEVTTRQHGGFATLRYQLDPVDKLKYMLNNMCLTPPTHIEYNYTEYQDTWVDPATLRPAPPEHQLEILVTLIHQGNECKTM